MRMCNLTLDGPVKDWSPKFKAAKASRRRQPLAGEGKTGVVSYFPTLKGVPRMEGLRHYFHADMAEILEMDPAVAHWTARTEAFTFDGGGKPLTVRPDFMAVTAGGQRAIRLRRAGRTHDLSRQAELHTRFAERGIVFETLTDADLAADPRVGVAKELGYHRYRDCRAGLVLRCVEAFHALPQPTLGALHADLGGDGGLWFELLSLAAKGFVEIDLADGLTAGTPVRACKLASYCHE